MAFDINSLRKSQEEANSKYRVSGGDYQKVITMGLTHEGKENKVVVSLLPPRVNGINFYEVSESGNLIIPYSVVFINGKFFEIMGTQDDPINTFLWNRYNDYKAKGLDTSNLVLPQKRYLAVAYVHKNAKEPDYNGTVQVIGLSRTLLKSLREEENDYFENYPDAFMFGLVDVATWQIKYEMVNTKFGNYHLAPMPPSNVIDIKDPNKAEEDISKIAQQTESVCAGYNRVATGKAFEKYDSVVKRFIDTVGLAAWKKYGPGSVAAVSTNTKNTASVIDDDLPDDYKVESVDNVEDNAVPWEDAVETKLEESVDAGAEDTSDDDDINLDDLMAEIDKEIGK